MKKILPWIACAANFCCAITATMPVTAAIWGFCAGIWCAVGLVAKEKDKN